MKLSTARIALPLLAGLAAPSVSGADFFLTVGGGHSPAGNQVSLEKNVLFYQKFLSEQFPDGTSHTVLFSDGNSPNPDVQFLPENQEVPEANRLMAALFGSTADIGLDYRDKTIPYVGGAASPAEIESWFQETGASMSPGDRLVLYVTAHGGRSRQKDNPRNSRVHLWNHASIDVAGLRELIGGLPEGVGVVTVMVQCFSGGFADLIFEEDDGKRVPSGRPICGFFATVHDRESAGCTPDINEENYDEFSTHFWAAIRGETRTGTAIERPDFDGDGAVSFEEAHAYTMMTSRNIDVPMKTSEAFLQTQSALCDEDHPELLGPDSPYFTLLTFARPAELAVLERLSSELGLAGSDRAGAAKDRADEAAEKRGDLSKEGKEKREQYERLRRQMRTDIRNRWPELSNTLSPGAQALLAERAPAFVDAVKAHPKYGDWTRLAKERKALEGERFSLDKKWARHQRFLRTLETVARAANLPSVSDPETVEIFHALVAMEAGTVQKRPCTIGGQTAGP